MSSYFSKVKNSYFSTHCQNWYQATKLKPNQTMFDRAYSNLTSFSFIKKIKVFKWLSKLKFFSFVTKGNTINGDETKSDNFSWDISYFFIKKVSISMTFKSEILSFMTTVNPNNGNETKSDIFHETYSNLASFVLGFKILKISMAFIIGFFQVHCKSEHKQVK